MAHPADPTDLVPDWAGQFTTFTTWVNKASSWIGCGGAVCIDAKGRPCKIGKDFMRARDEEAFPVRFFFEMKPAVDHPFAGTNFETRDEKEARRTA